MNPDHRPHAGITGKNRELGTLWPSRMVRTMPNVPRTNANQHARLISTPIVPSVAVMGVTGVPVFLLVDPLVLRAGLSAQTRASGATGVVDVVYYT